MGNERATGEAYRPMPVETMLLDPPPKLLSVTETGPANIPYPIEGSA